MSLLIKALESAEKGKQAELTKGRAADASSMDLVLEPLSTAEPGTLQSGRKLNSPPEDISNKADSFNVATAAVAKARQQSEIKKDSKQQVAANVFVANQSIKNSTSATTLLMLGVAGALFILGGLQGYQYLSKLNAPEAVVVKPDPSSLLAASSAQPIALMPETQTGVVQSPAAVMEKQTSDAEQVPKSEAHTDSGAAVEAAFIGADNTAVAKSDAGNKTVKKIAGSRAAEYGDTSSEHSEALKKEETSLKLVARTSPAGVDPTLLSAYQAYNRGDDAAAQKQYRQVLQSDTRNVDALLGMAAIALRQTRYADANGWYQKVLEIEPKNSIALSAIENSQLNIESAGSGSADYAGAESRIKSLLAQQPEAANLHAALGNLYAAQNQWPLAQASYFNASRYAPNSADYAFNLAVSLDQLGKSGLALAQYQRALDLLNSMGAGNLDKAQLEARIKALQQ